MKQYTEKILLTKLDNEYTAIHCNSAVQAFRLARTYEGKTWIMNTEKAKWLSQFINIKVIPREDK